MLDVQHLSFTARSGRVILDDISLQVQPGEVLAIIGPNGAGKSTLAKSITGLEQAHSQTMTLAGRSLTTMNRVTRARHIAYLPQITSPVPSSVFDAVLLGRRPHMHWLPGAKDRFKVVEILDELGMKSMAQVCVTRLSGGEMQKVLIARALVQETPVLILDEPINHLDIRNQIEILDCVVRMTTKRKMCTLLVLHHLSYAMRYAQKTLLLHQGRQFFFGPSQDVSAESLSQVYAIPITLHTIQGVPHALF
ncbi:MAG: ABC transporter ATP-binding protein [Desulfomicrobium sp.]|jgi:iron complex transport system ATP-binding protein|nr:ABC transporter ATP-binding protein [Desulfomicrobium sp.]